MPRPRRVTQLAENRNLYRRIYERAMEDLEHLDAPPHLEDDVYPHETLSRYVRDIVQTCEAGEPLRVDRWRLPRDHPLRDRGESFVLYPDGRVEVA